MFAAFDMKASADKEEDGQLHTSASISVYILKINPYFILHKNLWKKPMTLVINFQIKLVGNSSGIICGIQTHSWTSLENGNHLRRNKL